MDFDTNTRATHSETGVVDMEAYPGGHKNHRFFPNTSACHASDW